MPDVQIRGAINGASGAPSPFTAVYDGATRFSPAHGDYFDAAIRGRLFWAAHQAATAFSVALTAAYTGIVVSNPLNSGAFLVMLQAGFALSVAPAAIASLGFIAGYASTGLTVHTTSLTPLSTILNQDQATGVAKADAAATLPGTPRWCGQFMGGFTAAALPSTSPSVLDLKGAFIVPPGGYFAIGALTAITGLASLLWEEVPIIAAQ